MFWEVVVQDEIKNALKINKKTENRILWSATYQEPIL